MALPAAPFRLRGASSLCPLSARATCPQEAALCGDEGGKDQKDIWTRIDAALPHSSGTGFNIQIEALPMDDRIVLTEPKPDEAKVPTEAE